MKDGNQSRIHIKQINPININPININPINRIALICLCGLFSACASEPEKADDPFYAPIVVPQVMPPEPKVGSLYRPGFNMVLFDDRRASQVGDIITIMLDERTISSKSAGAKIDKNSKNELNEASVLGTNLSFDNLNILSNLSMLTNPEHKRSFNGKAEADQSNRLEGAISAVVSDVLPNGNLVVKGEKWIELNNGKEFIRVSGVVRQDDIKPDNTISSEKLANARISYSGTGDLAEASKRGWIDSFFSSSYWPF